MVVTKPPLSETAPRAMKDRMKPKILVVDDEPEAVELVEFNLRQAGFDVVTADDGEDALKKTRACLPQLIVPDLMLPDMNDVAVDFIRATAACHQFHEGTPPFDDGCQARKDRCRAQGPAFRFELFKGRQDLSFFGRHYLDRAGRITGERSALRSQGDCQ